MIFVEFTTKDCGHSWGYYLPFPPSIGDRLFLAYAPTGGKELNGVFATVTQREYTLPWDDGEEFDKIEATIELDSEIDGTAHSQEWPARDKLLT